MKKWKTLNRNEKMLISLAIILAIGVAIQWNEIKIKLMASIENFSQQAN